MNEERLKSRTKMMTKLIRFAQALHRENNLNSLLAVVSGLNNAAIHRLKFTQEDVLKTFHVILCSFTNLYAFRTAL